MENIFNKELIAFQSVDSGGDIWCNDALLFESEGEVKLFFENPNKVIEILQLEINEGAGETIDGFMSIFADNETINAVKINLEYCGQKWIKRMSGGFVIRNH